MGRARKTRIDLVRGPGTVVGCGLTGLNEMGLDAAHFAKSVQ